MCEGNGEVMENSDWACIINIEKRRDTGQAYLTFKRVKIRYKFKSDLTYFNHPFAEDNGVKLVDDIHLDESLSELTLATDLDGAEIKTRKGSRTAAEREVISDEEAAKFLDFEIVRSKHQVKPGEAA